MGLAELLQAVRDHPEHVVVPASWGQGRAGFGGLVAALLYECMRVRVAEDRPLRSLALTFVGPLALERPASFHAELLREGRAVSQLAARLLQDGQVVSVVQASFGAARESAVAVAAEPAPTLPAVDACQALPSIPGVTPAFTRHLEMRWGIGGLPFSGSSSRQMGGWVRLREEPREPLGAAQLLALVDAWPPAVLSHLTRFAPGSSLTWTVEFIQPLPALDTHAWCRYRAEIEHAGDGYGHCAAALWSPDGELLALSRQLVTVFG